MAADEVAAPTSPLPFGGQCSSASGPNPNPARGLDPDFFNLPPSLAGFHYDDDSVTRQLSTINAVEAAKMPFVGDKEPLSALAAEFQSGSPILLEKIKMLGEQYSALRRTRGDGNCFYRSFMFSFLEHILETQDKVEGERVREKVEQLQKTLQFLGYVDFTFEDFFTIFIDQLEGVMHVNETPLSHEELLERSRDGFTSDCVVMFFRFITAGEIQRRADFFEPFIAGLTNTTVKKFCSASVEPMGEECDHVHIIALSDALSVPIRVVYLDRSLCDPGNPNVNHHDFIPTQEGAPKDDVAGKKAESDRPRPYVTLLYRPGHYDILYPM